MINRVECHHGTRCPYLNGEDVLRLLSERDYLSQQLDKMEKVMALAQAEIERLRQENQKLNEERETMRYELKQMLGKIFKPGVKQEPDVSRPKRGAPCGHRGNSRRRPEEISEFIDPYPDRCDKCGGRIKAYEKNYDEHVV